MKKGVKIETLKMVSILAHFANNKTKQNKGKQKRIKERIISVDCSAFVSEN